MKRIAIAAGGDSSEYDISVKSAANVFRHIDRKKYEPWVVHMKDGLWEVETANGKKTRVNKNDFSFLLKGKKIKFDCVFVAVHGTPGEDGKLQGYFDMLGIPYTSSGVHTLAITFNKKTCKDVVRNYGVLTADSVLVRKGVKFNPGEIVQRLNLPCFVKPNNGGSSCGVTKVKQAGELKAAVEKAFAEDNETLIEPFIHGTELTCGVFSCKDKITALPVTEIVSKNEFFDYEAKYTPGGADEITPARIPDEIARMVKETSCRMYGILHCKGIIRIDYIWNGKQLFFLEVNTVPGLTEVSIIPRQAKAAGISPEKLFSMMIEDAVRK